MGFTFFFLNKDDSFFTKSKFLKTETWHRYFSLKNIKLKCNAQLCKENIGKWRMIPKLWCGITVILCNGKTEKVDKGVDL